MQRSPSLKARPNRYAWPRSLTGRCGAADFDVYLLLRLLRACQPFQGSAVIESADDDGYDGHERERPCDVAPGSVTAAAPAAAVLHHYLSFDHDFIRHN